jgi:kynurenine formamidase
MSIVIGMKVFNVECRVVDLSLKLYPGREKRRLEIRRFSYIAGEYMYDIDTMSHIGTHVECPSHYVNARYGVNGADLSEIPVEVFLGEAVFIDLSYKSAREPVTVEDLERAGVREGDIVLIGNSRFTGEDSPYISPEAAKWLAENRVKMVGVDDSVQVEAPGNTGSLELMATHDYLLSNNIPIIERLCNLDRLGKRRFLFIGLPVNIVGLDSFPIRAVVLEPV